MNMGQAAVAAILAGIAVAGFVWWSTGVVSNVQYMLKNRVKAKPAAGDTPEEE